MQSWNYVGAPSPPPDAHSQIRSSLRFRYVGNRSERTWAAVIAADFRLNLIRKRFLGQFPSGQKTCTSPNGRAGFALTCHHAQTPTSSPGTSQNAGRPGSFTPRWQAHKFAAGELLCSGSAANHRKPASPPTSTQTWDALFPPKTMELFSRSTPATGRSNANPHYQPVVAPPQRPCLWNCPAGSPGLSDGAALRMVLIR